VVTQCANDAFVIDFIVTYYDGEDDQ